MTTTIDTPPEQAVTEYTQPTATPTAKVKAVGKAGIVTTAAPALVALAAFAGFNPNDAETGINLVVAAVAAIVAAYNAVSAVIQFFAGYMKKSDTANGAKKEL